LHFSRRRRVAGARFFAALADKFSQTDDLFGAARHASAAVISCFARSLGVRAEQHAVRIFAL
jgi:hypothetical protein